MLVCPDAAKASDATTIRAGALVISFEAEVQHNKLATRIRVVCVRLVESNQARFFGRYWCAKRPKTQLPVQKLCTISFVAVTGRDS